MISIFQLSLVSLTTLLITSILVSRVNAVPVIDQLLQNTVPDKANQLQAIDQTSSSVNQAANLVAQAVTPLLSSTDATIVTDALDVAVQAGTDTAKVVATAGDSTAACWVAPINWFNQNCPTVMPFRCGGICTQSQDTCLTIASSGVQALVTPFTQNAGNLNNAGLGLAKEGLDTVALFASWPQCSKLDAMAAATATSTVAPTAAPTTAPTTAPTA